MPIAWIFLSFADGGYHDTHYIRQAGLFGHQQVAVAHQRQFFALAADDAVKDDSALLFPGQHGHARLQVGFAEWTQDDAVALVHKKGCHAVSPYGDGYGVSLIDEACHFGQQYLVGNVSFEAAFCHCTLILVGVKIDVFIHFANILSDKCVFSAAPSSLVATLLLS